MSKRRVVITGLGMISPVGNTVDKSWEAVKSGESGISNIDFFDTTLFSTKFAGLIKDFNVEEYMPRKEARKMDLFIQYGVAAAEQAFQDSGILVTAENEDRIGVAIGSGIGGLGLIEKNKDSFAKSGPRKISPFFVPSTIINMISGHVSINKGLKGPNIAVTTACTTGTHSIGLGARMIQYGDADMMIVGGAEKASTELGMGGFGAARALSTRNDSPETASRPWDKDRDGFVLGDGAGVLVLEEYEHAKARGAKIYAEFVGFGMSGDAYHMTSPPADGAGAAAAMRNALKDAKINATDIQYINAHGTSTPAGDLAENQAVKTVWGDAVNDVMMSSTKSMTGHLLGAAGAIEAIFSVLALKDQLAPPTINLENPSEGCDLDYVTDGKARPANLEYVLSNSFGFGGTNASLIFKRI
ncbi:beta-ketoacyl-[acyl-carrier-protein] synthase II [Psychromonas sp. MB-3u-54]|uniref:beta-ketoacyl-ACP synthase II n=1 Tax=Psychromonas sp. MB-3u-54 TaxID=2058319 RepID=UPI000C34F834|nr:beta-ketoacyl-ACP synthase II [Psychromonas sp. MB-3u-54]PKH04059.1 beta-ketoacyl-[acyl-carrier-protein] synthase II [Psychromonas sp. MB-3u-54]